MKVLVCGSRYWDNKAAIFRELYSLVAATKGQVSMVVGDARGADSQAIALGEEMSIPTTVYKANWVKYGRAAGPIRNKQMLDEEKPDLVLAFHNDIDKSKGTADMLRQTIKAGIPFRLIKS